MVRPRSAVPQRHRARFGGVPSALGPRGGGDPIDTQNPYRLGSLGDLIGLLLDGWQVEHLHYADTCSLEGADGRPAAFALLVRGDAREHLYIVDDGRALSHRSLIAMFREHPHVWKRRSTGLSEMVDIPSTPPQAAEEWGAVPEPFPDALDLSPGTLRGVVPVNQTQSVDQVTISITCLERFEHGARIHYLCHAPDARSRGEMGALDVIAVDDTGRLYRVAPGERTQRGNRITGTLAVAPCVPPGTRQVTVTIGTLGHDAGDALPGPWVFPIPLE